MGQLWQDTDATQIVSSKMERMSKMTGFRGTTKLNKMVILEIKSIDGLVIVEHHDQRAG